MSPNESRADAPEAGAAEPTAVLPETAAQLVELERLQQALEASEERAKNHWDQYLRAVAELDNVRKRAARDIEAASRYGLERLVERAAAGQGQPRAGGADPPPRPTSAPWSRARRPRCGCSPGAREARGEGGGPGGRALRPGPARGHDGAGLGYRRAELGACRSIQPGYELNGRLLRPARVIVSGLRPEACDFGPGRLKAPPRTPKKWS